jgi:XTP/dITP diphosphohydrolase
MKRLRIGTANPGKLREYDAILRLAGYEPVPVVAPDPDETAPDLEGNARIKAIAYAAAAGELTVAEDAGLIVPSLGGLPGVVSARFSDCQLDVATGRVLAHASSGRPRAEMDEENRALLLRLLEGKAGAERAAYFQVVLVVAEPGGEVLFTATGEAHGRILTAPRGDDGFGYDALFAGDETGGLSFAEVAPAAKNAVSHRRKALDKLRAWLERGGGQAG